MSTLDEVIARGDLIPFEDAEGPPPLRRLLALRRAVGWFEIELPALTTTLSGGRIDPAQQVDVLFSRFAAGQSLIFWTDFHPFKHIGNGIWKLKTLDVRITGWFYRKDVFIIARGDEAFHVKRFALDHGLMSEAVQLRADLGLDAPSHVPGDDPDAVLSNWNIGPR